MKIKKLQKSELSSLMFYSKLEHWDIEEPHLLSLFEVHADDFFIAHDGEQLLGFILALKHTQNFGFISTFLILKEFRGQGYGKKLFLFALEHLKGCQIALDSVVDKESIYLQHDFKSYFDVITYKFLVGSVNITEDETATINFDKKLSLQGHDAYMQAMLTNKDVSYKAIKKESCISSFAFTFKYLDGHKIYINSEDINEAVILFFALTREFKNTTAIYLQATKLSPILLALVEALKMSEHSKFIRMYNKVLAN